MTSGISKEDLEARLARLERELRPSRSRRRLHAVVGLGAIGLVVAPLLGGANPIPHLDPVEDFSGPISGMKMRENFQDIEDRLAGVETVLPSALAHVAESGSTGVLVITNEANSAPFAPVAGLLLTDFPAADRRVRLELIPSGGTDESFIDVEPQQGTDYYLRIRLERSPTGEDDWTAVATVVINAYDDDGQDPDMSLPPGAVSFWDAPGEGSFDYRIVASPNCSAGPCDAEATFSNVRLLAQTIAVDS